MRPTFSPFSLNIFFPRADKNNSQVKLDAVCVCVHKVLCVSSSFFRSLVATFLLLTRAHNTIGSEQRHTSSSSRATRSGFFVTFTHNASQYYTLSGEFYCRFCCRQCNLLTFLPALHYTHTVKSKRAREEFKSRLAIASLLLLSIMFARCCCCCCCFIHLVRCFLLTLAGQKKFKTLLLLPSSLSLLLTYLLLSLSFRLLCQTNNNSQPIGV